MVKRNIPISRELDYDCDPTCPSYQQDILSVGVNSLNGLLWQVVPATVFYLSIIQ